MYTFRTAELSPSEEHAFEALMTPARTDAWTLGIHQRIDAYLDQFKPTERMQHVLGMFAALENQFELCQRLLAVELEANPYDQENTEPARKVFE
jgi:hypothetical protein